MSSSPLIGFDMLHYSPLTESSDVVGGTPEYATPKRVIGAISATVNPNSSTDSIFADNGPSDTATALGKIELELGAKDFPLEDQAIMLGHKYMGGMLVRGGADIPPWLAVGGRSLKANGAYRYFWLYKGKMAIPEQKHETLKDKVDFQTPTLKGNFVKRDCDQLWMCEYDTDNVFYDASVETNWFKQVMSLSDIPMVYCITPYDRSVGVAVNAVITITFNKELDTSKVNTTNFTLKQDTSAVTCTVALDASKKVVTITPSAALTAGKTYTVGVSAAVGISADRTTTFNTVSA